MRDRMVGGGLMTLALVALIGCNGSSGASSAPASSAPESAAASVAAPSEAAPSEAAPSEAAPSQAAASGLPSFTLPSSDKELEALIPATACGAPVTKLSMKGSEIFANSEDNTIQAVLQGLGKSVDDVSAAAGFNLSDAGCGVFIFRIKGASEDQLRSVFQKMADDEGTKFEQTSIGGKTVYKSTEEDKPQYVWIKGDGLISVAADTEAHAAELISQLP
jgi:hypothetical protein